MAQGVKAAQLQVPSAVGGGRPASRSTRVASLGNAPVEELNPKLGASFDDAYFLLQDFGRGQSPQDRDHSHHQAVGMLRATSQAFAAFLEFESGSNRMTAAGSGGSHGSAGLVSRAIAAYEDNARVVSGAKPTLGTSLSVTL